MKNLICNLSASVFSIILVVALCTSQNLFAQDDDFRTEYGKRLSYEVEVPCRFHYKKPVGKNIDLNFIDDRGNNINVLIVSFPGLPEQVTIQDMASMPDEIFVEETEGIGMNDVRVINRGLTWYGGIQYYFAYHTSVTSGAYGKSTHYHHSITQIRDNTMVVLTYTCDFHKKDREMAHISRVMQSFEINWD